MLEVKKNIGLKNYTTFKIGGAAKFFVEAGNEEELIEALKYAEENNLAFFILGGGSNILVSDEGFDGIIIKLKTQSSKLKTITQNEKQYTIEAFAGENLSNAVNFAAENSLAGLEWAAGIPGTIGGAIRGNAGAFGKSIADVVESVKIIEISKIQDTRYKIQRKSKFQIKDYKLQDCKFGYRDSVFKENKNLIIISAVLKLKKGDKEEIQAKILELILKRKDKQPKGFSAGSFFKNPVVEDEKLRKEFETEKGIKVKDEKLPAGWLIEKADLAGKKIGGAMISEKHANVILNIGNAKAQDVIILVSMIKQKVRDMFDVELHEEVRYLGFS